MSDPATPAPAAPAPNAPTPAPSAPTSATPAAPAAPASPTAPAAPTIGSGNPDPNPAAPGTPPAAPVAPTWPDDWREQMAGTDEALLKRLKRFTSPGAVASGLQSWLKRSESGEFKKPLAKDATEDEVKTYRAENGIPETADKYELSDGLEVSDLDKPLIDSWKNLAHSKNWTPDVVKDGVDFFFQAQEAQKEQMYEADRQFHDESVGVLKAEWGKEYNSTINGLKQFIEQQSSPEFFNVMMGARLGDGSLAGDNPTFLKLWANVMREINPAAALVGSTSTNPMTDIDGELAKYNKMMREDRKGYDRDPKNAERVLELIRAKEKLSKRAA